VKLRWESQRGMQKCPLVTADKDEKVRWRSEYIFM